jgi:hypothetical protein
MIQQRVSKLVHPFLAAPPLVKKINKKYFDALHQKQIFGNAVKNDF